MFKHFSFIMPCTQPLNWLISLSFFRLHQIIGVEKISEHTYQRIFQIGKAIGFFSVTYKQPNLTVEVLTSNATVLPLIKQRVRKMFDLDMDQSISKQFSYHPLLSDMCAKYPALRIPGGFEVFETAINTILSQLISSTAARKILAKLVAKHGKKIINPISKEVWYLFPKPEVLFSADLAELGITKIKTAAIKELSRRVIGSEINLENQDIQKLKTDLLKVPGIGPWTVEYIALRCFEKNAFPLSDLILARYLKEYPDLKQFTLWRSYLAIYLWQHYLSSKQKI